MTKVFALALIAALAGFGLHAFAQSRADVRPAVTSLGSSSSNGISFAWFYDSTERAVYVCRAGHGSGDTVECKARTTLP
jgi:hypothetical protein